MFPDGVRSGRIAVVRGFDVANRELRGAVADLTRKLALHLLDVPSAPAFGAIPAAAEALRYGEGVGAGPPVVS